MRRFDAAVALGEGGTRLVLHWTEEPKQTVIDLLTVKDRDDFVETMNALQESGAARQVPRA